MHASLWLVVVAALLLGAIGARVAYLRRRRLGARPRPLPPSLPAPPPPGPAPEAEAAPEPPTAPAPAALPPAPPPEPPPPPPREGAPEPPPPPAPLVLRRERPLLAIPRPARGPTRYPVVLAHGFAGFDGLAIRGRRIAYFKGVSERLRASGVDVHVLRVSPLAPIAARAEELAAQIARLGADRVNIVAHSMGGLDARYAIARLGMAPRVASLITIGTPHRGTPLADLAGTTAISGAFGRVPALLGGIHDLCPRQMALFNEAVDDVPGVAYGCVVAAARRGLSRVNTLLLPGYLFLRRRAGDNDGVVPASSQRWGVVWGEIDADHWGAVGWSRAFDAAAFYEWLARDLGRRGF